MSTAASFNIYSFDIYNSNSVARNNTTLIQIEPMLGFGLLFAFEILSDWVTLQYNPISFVFDLHLNLFADG